MKKIIKYLGLLTKRLQMFQAAVRGNGAKQRTSEGVNTIIFGRRNNN
jgi:hypothetical protein